MNAKDRKEKLKKFSTGDLRAELVRRDQKELDDSRDRTRRRFYRKVEIEFKNGRERARFITNLPESQEIMESRGGAELYLLDSETAQEAKVRLSRTATVNYDYDYWKTTFYEEGQEVGSQGMDGESDHYAADWESRGSMDDENGWDLDRAKDYLGHSSKPIEDYQY